MKAGIQIASSGIGAGPRPDEPMINHAVTWYEQGSPVVGFSRRVMDGWTVDGGAPVAWEQLLTDVIGTAAWVSIRSIDLNTGTAPTSATVMQYVSHSGHLHRRRATYRIGSAEYRAAVGKAARRERIVGDRRAADDGDLRMQIAEADGAEWIMFSVPQPDGSVRQWYRETDIMRAEVGALLRLTPTAVTPWLSDPEWSDDDVDRIGLTAHGVEAVYDPETKTYRHEGIESGSHELSNHTAVTVTTKPAGEGTGRPVLDTYRWLHASGSGRQGGEWRHTPFAVLIDTLDLEDGEGNVIVTTPEQVIDMAACLGLHLLGRDGITHSYNEAAYL